MSHIDTFYSNQTILEFCENWFDDYSTLTMIFQAAPGAISSNKATLERLKDTFYFILYSETQCISKLDKIGIFIDMKFH